MYVCSITASRNNARAIIINQNDWSLVNSFLVGAGENWSISLTADLQGNFLLGVKYNGNISLFCLLLLLFFAIFNVKN